MKFHGLNLRKHKLFIRWIETYLLLVVILAAVTVPIYLQTYNSVKKSVISDTQTSVEHGVKLLQNELDTYYAILNSLKSNRDYKWLMDLSGTPQSEDYLHMASLQKYYRDMLLSSFIQDNTFIMFAQNDIVFSKYAAFNDMREFYGSIWEFDGLGYEEMRQIFFSKKYYGEFLSGVRFRELETKQESDIIFAFTVSGGEQSESGTVLFSVYDTEKILSLLGLNQIAESGRIRLLNSQGEEILKVDHLGIGSGKEADMVYTSPNSCITVEVSISDSFYGESLASVRAMLWFYGILFFVLGLGLSLFFAYRNGLPLKNLVNLLSAGGDYPVENEYEYIREYIARLSHSYALTETQMLDNMLIKLLFTDLGAKEQDEFKRLSEGRFLSVSLVLIKSDTVNWGNCIENALEEMEGIYYKSILLDTYTKVIFFDEGSMDAKTMNSIIFDLNRENEFHLKGVMSAPYSLLSDTAETFNSLRELIKYADPCMFLTLDNFNSHRKNIDFAREYYAERKPFYEYLLSGNAFEANKIVYQQWYQLSTSPGTSNDIANLFYYQTGILSQLVIDIGFDEPPPVFSNESDVLTNAMSVTQYVSRLCEYIESRNAEPNRRSAEILEYINTHYQDPSFYLTSLSEEFALSVNTITQSVKKITGMTFSIYLNKLRLEHVAKLLRETELPVQDIAPQSGFASTNSLLKSFKKEYGVSPTVYRKNNQTFL